MDKLARDHRTASIAGDRMSRWQLAASADTLLAELGDTEVAERVLSTAGIRPDVVVITGHRLIAVPVTGGTVRTVRRPYRITVGNSGVLGQTAEAVDAAGNRLKLRVTPGDLTHLQQAAATTTGAPGFAAAPDSRATPPGPTAGYGDPAARWSGPGDGSPAPAPAGPWWRWSRPVLSWQDAEHLAAAHLTSLGFADVLVTAGGRDEGLDVVAHDLAAQVKFHAAPTGAPDIQRLRGAADAFPHRLFYSAAYTTAAHTTADRLGIALFQYTTDGGVVARHLDGARTGGRQQPERTVFGTLTFEARQNRAVGWAQKIEQTARTKPVSDRKRNRSATANARAPGSWPSGSGLSSCWSRGWPSSRTPATRCTSAGGRNARSPRRRRRSRMLPGCSACPCDSSPPPPHRSRGNRTCRRLHTCRWRVRRSPRGRGTVAAAAGRPVDAAARVGRRARR